MSWGTWLGKWFGTWLGDEDEQPDPSAPPSFVGLIRPRLPTAHARAHLELPAPTVVAHAIAAPPISRATTRCRVTSRAMATTARARSTAPVYHATARCRPWRTHRIRAVYNPEPALRRLRADDDVLMACIIAQES